MADEPKNSGKHPAFTKTSDQDDSASDRPRWGLTGWTVQRPLTQPRFGLGAATIDDRVVVFGGQTQTIPYMDVVEVLDSGKTVWTQARPMPEPRTAHATVVRDERLFAIGGWCGKIVDTMWSYAPAEDRWAALAPLPYARSAVAAAVWGGRIYVFGGWTKDDGYLRETLVYIPERDVWETRAPMREGREGMVAVAIPDGMLVIGGLNGDPTQKNKQEINFLNTAELYDPLRDRWTTWPSLRVPRFGPNAFIRDDVLWVACGFSGSSFLRSVEGVRFTEPDPKWEIGPALETGRFGSALSGDTIFGGLCSGTDLSSVEQAVWDGKKQEDG